MLTYFGQTYPLIFQVTVLKHDQKNKTILLLGDLHSSSTVPHMKYIACKNEIIANFEDLQKNQMDILCNFVTNMLHVAHKKTCIITETPISRITPTVNQEAGITQEPVQNEEAFHYVARLLLRDLMKTGNTPDEKSQFVNNSFVAGYLGRFPGFVINPTIVWVPGDTLRTDQDDRLCHDIFTHALRVIEALKQPNPPLHQEVKELTIGFVKAYIVFWQEIFANHSVNDLYGESLVVMLNDVISKSGLSDTDHFIQLYQYLVDNNLKDKADDLRIKVLYFIAQKQDLELRFHADAITASRGECDQAVVVAGVTHTQLLRDYLLTQGYTITHQAGIEYEDSKDEDPLFYEQIVEQTATLNNNFDAVAQSILA